MLFCCMFCYNYVRFPRYSNPFLAFLFLGFSTFSSILFVFPISVGKGC